MGVLRAEGVKKAEAWKSPGLKRDRHSMYSSRGGCTDLEPPQGRREGSQTHSDGGYPKTR